MVPSSASVPAPEAVASSRPTDPAEHRAPRAAWVLPVVIGGIAFAVRLTMMLHAGGLLALGEYDDGVYYAAADALVHGRLPYLDFLLLHPPGVALAVAPFAALGSITTDQTGLVVARLVFELIGGLNAALVVVVLRRFGFAAALTGGALYAVLLPAVWAEHTVMLEPLGTAGVLLSLVLIGRPVPGPAVVAAGLMAGWAMDVKIWYIVPAAVIACFVPRHRWRFVLAAFAGVAAVCVPFLVAAPAAMVREVVLDQLGRPRGGGLLARLAGVLGVRDGSVQDVRSATLVLAVLAVLAVAACLRTRGGRLFAVLLLATGTVVALSPSWFEHYGAFTAPPLALCVGIAVQRLVDLVPAGRWVGPVVAVPLAIVVVAGGVQADGHRSPGRTLPVAFTTAVEQTPGCVLADDPTALALSDVLSRDLTEPRCTVWPDVTGWTYDRADLRTADGQPVPRLEDPRWQRMILDYLRSGSAWVTVRSSTGVDRATRAELDEGAPLVHVDRLVLHAGARRSHV